jgi:hypothetical protein
MKTNQLKGLQLAWAVGKALDKDSPLHTRADFAQSMQTWLDAGGALKVLDDHKISVVYEDAEWHGWIGENGFADEMRGQSMMEAGLRALVLEVLGENAGVPEGLG